MENIDVKPVAETGRMPEINLLPETDRGTEVKLSPETEQDNERYEMPDLTPQVTTGDLALYYYNECFFCRKILKKLDEYKLEIELKNIREDRKNYEELKRINHGITQVPCLTIKGEPMLESDDIIYYLIETFVKD